MVELFYATHLSVIGLATLGLFLFATEGSFYLGRLRAGRDDEGQVGALIGGLIGLLGLLLAFTFGMADARYEMRTNLLVDEVNVIRTAYLRTDLLPEPRQREAQQLLSEYVDLQLDAFRPGRAAQAIAASEPLLGKLWSLAAGAAEEKPTPFVSLFVQSINDVIGGQAKRLYLGWHNHLPLSIIGTLYVVSVLALGVMGFEGGVSGNHRPIASPVLAFTLAAVVLLILDLDRPLEGLLRQSPQALIDLHVQMTRPGP